MTAALTSLLDGCDNQTVPAAMGLCDPDTFYAAEHAELIEVRYDGDVVDARSAVRDASPSERARSTVHLTYAGRTARDGARP